jgi:NADPH:quinone reductase-like Zn-dependent oxidoreductase
VFDHVCLNGYYHKGHACLASGGKYIAYGMTSSTNPGSLPLLTVILFFLSMSLQNYFLFITDRKTAEFYNVGDRRDQKPEEFEEDFRKLVGLLEKKELEPFIGRIWSFPLANKALASIEKNEHIGKQIIQLAP